MQPDLFDRSTRPRQPDLHGHWPIRHRATRAAAVGAPWQGRTPQSAEASYEAAKALMRPDGAAISQASRYWRALVAAGSRGLTDQEAAELLRIQRSSVNARRAVLMAHIRTGGFRRGATGIKNTVWITLKER